MALTEVEEIEYLELLEEEERDSARENLLEFTEYTMGKRPNGETRFHASGFHKTYYSVLQLWADGIIKKLMISIPPQIVRVQSHSESSVSLLLC